MSFIATQGQITGLRVIQGSEANERTSLVDRRQIYSPSACAQWGLPLKDLIGPRAS